MPLLLRLTLPAATRDAGDPAPRAAATGSGRIEATRTPARGTVMVGAVTCRRRRRCHAALAAAVLLLAAAMVVTAAARPVRLPASALARRRIDSASAAAAVGTSAVAWADDSGAPGRRRRLAGPGSSPPTCRARCGRCSPCRATRVAIQPGAVGPQWEYYPEVWRCKCGNKLFMP